MSWRTFDNLDVIYNVSVVLLAACVDGGDCLPQWVD